MNDQFRKFLIRYLRIQNKVIGILAAILMLVVLIIMLQIDLSGNDLLFVILVFSGVGLSFYAIYRIFRLMFSDSDTGDKRSK